MKRLIPIIALVGSLSTGCLSIPDPVSTNDPTNVVSDAQNLSFDFRTSDLVSVDVNVFEQAVVTIMDKSPNQGGQVLIKGATDGGGYFSTEQEFPSHISEVYVFCQKLTGERMAAIVPVIGGKIIHGFIPEEPEGFDDVESVDCTSASVSLTGGGNRTYNSYTTVSVESGNTATGKITFNNDGELHICGTANFTKLHLNGTVNVVIHSGGKLTVSGLGMNDNSCNLTIESGGEFITNSNESVSRGTVDNYGTMDLNGKFTLNQNSEALTNHAGASIDVSDNNDLVNNSSLVNNGSISVGRDYKVGNNATTENSCTLEIDRDYQINSTIINYGTVTVGRNMQINSNGKISMIGDTGNGNFVQAKNLTWNGGTVELTNPNSGVTLGNTHVLKILSNTTINGGATFSNPQSESFFFCDSTGIETNNKGSQFMSGYISCSYSMPTGGCFSSSPDSDSDGVPDDLDDFVNDSTRAFLSFYPDTFGTYAVEDLWPCEGDFDFNDLVIKYQYQHIKHASNEYVEIIGQFIVHAVGAGKENGFAVKIDGVSKSDVSGVSGLPYDPTTRSIVSLNSENLESSPTEPVIVVYDNVNPIIGLPAGRFYNSGGESYSIPDPDTATVTTTFNSPNTISLPSFKPVFFINKDRSHEVQLKDETPTNLMDVSLQNTCQDSTGGGRSFMSLTGDPFAIDIAGDFDVVVETNRIDEAYLKWDSWVSSNGLNFQDWYSNKEAGYRLQAKIVD